ncbi:MAG: caspase family protein [Caldilineaceae bacterium]
MLNPNDIAAMQPVSPAQLAWLLENFPWQRRIDAVHLHHSRRPNQRQFQGRATIIEMARHHVEGCGLSTVAQHLTIAPDGQIWLGRNWNLPPASAAGHNGSAVSGPFMLMLIGDFDRGQDALAFDGDAAPNASADEDHTRQGNAMLRVLAQLQNHFDLPLESLRFRRDLSGGSSPGSAVDYAECIKALRKARAALGKAEKEGKGFRLMTKDLKETRMLLHTFAQSAQSGADHGDGADAELPADAQGAGDFNRFTGASGEADRAFRGPEITPAMLDELSPYTINLSMGRFSTDGVMQTSAADVDAIFEDHLVRALQNRPPNEPLRIVFYAHGGLVGEKTALIQAYDHAPWWRQNNVYPIYFIWETGLWPMFFQSLRGSLDRAMAREAFTDGFIERLARGAGGPRVWQAIKSSAYTASIDPAGGARYVIAKLKHFLQEHGDNVELHAVGHSAGSIFHSYFVPTIIEQGIGAFRTLSFLAPAITVQDFKDRLARHVGDGIESLPVFTMRKELERKDPVASPWYNRSILYMVSHAMEVERFTPILGLEESLRADEEMKQIFGLRGQPAPSAEVIWTTTVQESGRSASHSASHVHFNCDPPTMNSVLRRVLGADDNDPIEPYPSAIACSADRALGSDLELTPELEWLAREGVFNAAAYFAPSIAQPSPAQPSTPSAPSRPVPAITIPSGTPSGGGRRRALCIGIDQYASAPLSGCVADAQMWAETLQGLGFEAPTLLLNGAATRGAILNAMSELVTSSRPGDVVVIQYAGHGTHLPDVSGDEVGEDSADDEAICPADYDSGAFLIDDDIGAVFAQTPAGVNVTCFFDCCHSGSVTRVAVGPSLAPAPGEKARFLKVTPAQIEAHRQFRREMGAQRSAPASRGPATMREVVFSACLSTEVALESNGHGHFTLRAAELLRAGFNGVSNDQFFKNVLDAFGSARRQTPVLDCAPAARDLPLLQPLGAISAVGGGAGNGGVKREMTAVELLRKMIEVLEG